MGGIIEARNILSTVELCTEENTRGVAVSMEFYFAVKFKISLALFCECWEKIRGAWIRDKGLIINFPASSMSISRILFMSFPWPCKSCSSSSREPDRCLHQLGCITDRSRFLRSKFFVLDGDIFPLRVIYYKYTPEVGQIKALQAPHC